MFGSTFMEGEMTENKPTNIIEYLNARDRLIQTAVNSCKSINPSNPQVVAESIEEMYELAKFVKDISCVSYSGNAEINHKTYYTLKEMAKQLLNKLEGK